MLSFKLIGDRKFLTLMLTMIVSIVTVPVVSDLAQTPRFGGLILVIVLVASINAVRGNRWTRRVVILLAVFAFVFGAGRVIDDTTLLSVGASVSIAIALVMTSTAIVRHIFATSQMTFEDICAAICVFLLAGIAWAVLFEVVLVFDSSSFRLPSDASASNSSMLYYSFVTLTTLGYGDITPIATAARMLAISEAIFGQLYVAVLIARLVSLQSSPRH